MGAHGRTFRSRRSLALAPLHFRAHLRVHRLRQYVTDPLLPAQRISHSEPFWLYVSLSLLFTRTGAAFGFGPNGLERGPHGGLPCGGNPLCPPLTCCAEVGAEFTGIIQPGLSVVLGERELLCYLRHRTADQPERNPPWPVERNSFECRGGQPSPVDRGGVLGQGHVYPAPKEHELPRHGPWRPDQIQRGSYRGERIR